MGFPAYLSVVANQNSVARIEIAATEPLPPSLHSQLWQIFDFFIGQSKLQAVAQRILRNHVTCFENYRPVAFKRKIGWV